DYAGVCAGADHMAVGDDVAALVDDDARADDFALALATRLLHLNRDEPLLRLLEAVHDGRAPTGLSLGSGASGEEGGCDDYAGVPTWMAHSVSSCWLEWRTGATMKRVPAPSMLTSRSRAGVRS